MPRFETDVSIPNGDRHYLEHDIVSNAVLHVVVSIPNGDRHYLELQREKQARHA